MKNNKRNIIMISTAVLLMILAVAGATYAFFTATITNGDKGSSVIIQTGNLRLVYSDTEYINVSGALPGDSYSKVVTVTNEGNVPVSYDLLWLELTNELVTKSDLTMEISCLSNTDTCDGLSSIVVSDSGSDIPILTNVEIGMLETHTYTIIIHFNETGSNQNDNQGKIISGKIGIVESSNATIDLYGYVYDENGDPMSSTIVELHSDPISVLTDENGYYEMSMVKLGNHTLYVKNADNSSTINTTSISFKHGDSTSITSNNILLEETKTSIGINIKIDAITPILSLILPSGVLKGTLGSNTYTGEYYAYKSSITSITFDDKIDIPGDAVSSWDVSSNTNGSVRAYIKSDGVSGYQLHIQSNGVMYAPVNSKNIFNGFSKVTFMSGLENINTSKVTDMSRMFISMSKMVSLDLSSFDTSNVTTMSYMFYGMSALTSLNLSNFNTSKVTSMDSMFESDMSLTSLNLNSFDTSSVTNMYFMFRKVSKLTTIDLSSFNTSHVTNMSGMFSEMAKLTSLNLSTFNTSNVTNMNNMFSGMSALKSLDLSGFTTTNVTNMSEMFGNCSSLTTLDLSHFNTSKVTTMSSMFAWCSSITSLNLSSFDTSNVMDMQSMFKVCSSLTSLNLSNFNTSKVESMSNMFNGMTKLTSLNLSSFNTSNVNYMSGMFEMVTSLASLDVSSFDTTNVYSMAYMFSNMLELASLNLSSFNTSSVTDMNSMFNYCMSLAALNLSSFDTSNVTDITAMFANCSALTSLDISNAAFTAENIIYSYYQSWDEQTVNYTFEGITSGITIHVKDSTAQTFINARLADASKTGTVTIG